MARKIQIRRGSTIIREALVLSNGEPFLDEDLNRLFIGDGTTLGGIPADGVAAAQEDITIAEAADTDLFAAVLFTALHIKIVADAGVGTYTAKYALPVDEMRVGAIVEVNLELAASANPTVELYDATSAGTLLATITNPAPGAAAYWYGRFRFDGTAWQCLFRAFNS